MGYANFFVNRCLGLEDRTSLAALLNNSVAVGANLRFEAFDSAVVACDGFCPSEKLIMA